jgi:hypothetical protein
MFFTGLTELNAHIYQSGCQTEATCVDDDGIVWRSAVEEVGTYS